MGGGQTLRVTIADDHEEMRAALREDLERGHIVVCAEAADGCAAVEDARRERPDLCLLDVHMPLLEGVEAAAEIKRLLPSTKVVLISAAPDGDAVLEAIDAGADGYLSKDIHPDRVPAVVRAVVAGETAFPRRALDELVRRLRSAL